MESGHLSREVIENQTFGDFGADRLKRLCRAVGMDDDERRILEAFGQFSRPWNRFRIGSRPRWYPSILSDDHAPFELSAAFSEGETEIQCYWEAQGEAPSLVSNMTTGLSVLEELSDRHGLQLDRWNAIKDLFLPERPGGLFTLLFGVTWGRRRPPRFKIYVNPYVRGSAAMPSLMQEAMSRLGFEQAWAADVERRARRGAKLDELMYVCLDVSPDPQARVKVYRRHYQATVAQIGALASIGGDYLPGDAERFYGLVAEQPGPFLAKPPITSLTFRRGDGERPCSMTLEFPISSYVGDDAVASARIKRCFSAYGLDPSRYERAVDAIATRPLEQGNGIHAHITFRRVNGAPRLTVYFATEAYPVEETEWAVQPESRRAPNSVRAPSSVRSPSSVRWAGSDEPAPSSRHRPPVTSA
jgi:DMATS type aromatic prenyltransferase